MRDMKIAVVGKGGSGKTTTSGVMARSLARAGHKVIGLDCDTNPNLGLSLGVGDTETERLLTLRDQVDEGGRDHATRGMTSWTAMAPTAPMAFASR